MASKMDITIYPNPTYGKFQIDISNVDLPRSAMIKVYSPGGAPVMRLTGISTSNSIDISRQPPGIYTIRIILDAENQEIFKIIKN